MKVALKRLVELWLIQSFRCLTPEEDRELKESTKLLNKTSSEIQKLRELSFIASQTNDADWQNEICERFENIIRS